MPIIEGVLDELAVTALVENSVSHASPLSGAHGLALLVTARSGDVERTVLVDTGPEAGVVLSNMKTMGIKPETIDLIVLTHCHGDHTGGLVGLVRAIGKQNLPIVAHPSVFRVLLATRPVLRYAGIDPQARSRVEALGGVFILTSDPLALMDGLGTTGEIPRVTDFEQPDISRVTVDKGRILEDSIPDDLALLASMRDGLVVITGCSHSGVINTLRRAREITGVSSIQGLAGGFHLLRAGRSRIEATVDELAHCDPSRIVSGHCTGTEAQFALRQRFGERFEPLVTGATFRF